MENDGKQIGFFNGKFDIIRQSKKEIKNAENEGKIQECQEKIKIAQEEILKYLKTFVEELIEDDGKNVNKKKNELRNLINGLKDCDMETSIPQEALDSLSKKEQEPITNEDEEEIIEEDEDVIFEVDDESIPNEKRDETEELVELIGEEEKTKPKKKQEVQKTFSNPKVAEVMAIIERDKKILLDRRVGSEWKNSTFGEVIRLKKSFQEYASKRKGEIRKELDNQSITGEQRAQLQSEFDEIDKAVEDLKKEIIEIRKIKEQIQEQKPKDEKMTGVQPNGEVKIITVTDRIIDEYERCQKVLGRSNLSERRKSAAEEEMKRIKSHFQEYVDSRKDQIESVLENENTSEGAKKQLKTSAGKMIETAEKLGMIKDIELATSLVEIAKKLGMSEEVEELSKVIKASEEQAKTTEESKAKEEKKAPKQAEKIVETTQEQPKAQQQTQQPTAKQQSQEQAPAEQQPNAQQQDQPVKQGSFRERVQQTWRDFIDTEKRLSKAEKRRNIARIKLGGVKTEKALRNAAQGVKNASDGFIQSFVGECRAKGESVLKGIESIIDSERKKAEEREKDIQQINQKINDTRAEL